jgi:hypothetical protein
MNIPPVLSVQYLAAESASGSSPRCVRAPVGGHLDLPSDGHEASGQRQQLRSRGRWSVPNCAVGVATAYLDTQSGTQPDRRADRRVRARLRGGQQSQEVIALSATGQLGTSTTGQIQLTVVMPLLRRVGAGAREVP